MAQWIVRSATCSRVSNSLPRPNGLYIKPATSVPECVCSFFLLPLPLSRLRQPILPLVTLPLHVDAMTVYTVANSAYEKTQSNAVRIQSTDKWQQRRIQNNIII